MLVTNSEEIANRARVLITLGISRNAWNRYGKGGSCMYDIEEPGYKMDNIFSGGNMKGIIILGVILLIILIFIFISNFLSSYMFRLLGSLGVKFGQLVVKLFPRNIYLILLCSEILYLIAAILVPSGVLFMSAMYGLDNGNIKYWFLIVIILLVVFIMFFVEFIFELRRVEKSTSLHIKISKKIREINTENYFFERLAFVFGKSGFVFTIGFYTIALTMQIATSIEGISLNDVYFTLILIPIGLILWIYVTSFDPIEQNLRRILVYILLAAIAFGKSYSDFKEIIGLTINDSIEEYFIYLILTLFITLDRLIKSVIDDFISYHKKKV